MTSRAERDLTERDEARRGAGHDLGDGDRVGPDVETDQAAGHESPPRTVCDSRYALELVLANAEVLADADRRQFARAMRRYTVMVDTRMVSATSRRVRRRCSPATYPSSVDVESQ